MRKFVWTALTLCAAVSVGALAQAQQPAAPPAAPPSAAPPAAPAAVPDQMPFDIPYGAPITADRAAQVVAAAVAEARKSPRNWKLAISVVDTNGDLVYFYKMDQTQIASVGISLGKARTAARYRRPSEIFFNQMQTQAGAFYATLSDPPPVASPGGFPLIEGGKLIGAIGCSGATGAQDGVACKAGADTVK
jgi:glc operon protein GlcG